MVEARLPVEGPPVNGIGPHGDLVLKIVKKMFLFRQLMQLGLGTLVRTFLSMLANKVLTKHMHINW